MKINRETILLGSSFHTTCINGGNYKWRYARGLPKNPNTAGPLTDLPDYTFIDGRTTPLGVSIHFIFRINFI